MAETLSPSAAHGKGKAEDTTQSEVDRLEGRAQPNWRRREPVWRGLGKSTQRTVLKCQGNCIWESRAHTDAVYHCYPRLMSVCVLVTALKLKGPNSWGALTGFLQRTFNFNLVTCSQINPNSGIFWKTSGLILRRLIEQHRKKEKAGDDGTCL